jgi:transposase
MAKRQFQLNETEIGQLRVGERHCQRTADLRRMQAVRLYGSGAAMAQIVDISGCAESSIREWVQDYKRGGIRALRAQYGGSAQNASKLTEAQRAEIRERLQRYRPDQLLSPQVRLTTGQFWTVRDLRMMVERWYGVVYVDPGSYHNLFHRCGFSYQRAERVYKSRPSEAEIADFQAELEKK